MSAAEFQRLYGSSGGGGQVSNDTPPKNSKYSNRKTELDGEIYDSAKEAEYMKQVRMMVAAEEITGYARQVVFMLPGKIKYIADFVLFYPDGSYAVVDVKGFRTDVYKLKKRLMRECRGVEIKEV